MIKNSVCTKCKNVKTEYRHVPYYGNQHCTVHKFIDLNERSNFVARRRSWRHRKRGTKRLSYLAVTQPGSKATVLERKQHMPTFEIKILPLLTFVIAILGPDNTYRAHLNYSLHTGSLICTRITLYIKI